MRTTASFNARRKNSKHAPRVGADRFAACEPLELAQPTHRNSTRAPAWTAGTGELGPARVHRIVITGGPCAGKTTAMSKLSLRLTNMGFDVFVVPELATLTITGGASPGSYDVAQHVGWETAILREQMHLEDCFEEIAANGAAKGWFNVAST